MTECANLLREVMVATGTSQVVLSRISGVKQPSISQFVSGRRKLTDDMLSRLLACMGARLEVSRRSVKVQLDRSHHRSWALHRRLAAGLNEQSLESWSLHIQRNLARVRLRVQEEPHVGNVERWADLIERRDVAAIRAAMTGLDDEALAMREVSPMAGLLPERERLAVLLELQRS